MQFSLPRSRKGIGLWGCLPWGNQPTPGISHSQKDYALQMRSLQGNQSAVLQTLFAGAVWRKKKGLISSFPTLNWNCNKNWMLSLIKCLTPDKMWGGGWRGNKLAARVLKESWNRALSCPHLRLLWIRSVGRGLAFRVFQYWNVIYL